MPTGLGSDDVRSLALILRMILLPHLLQTHCRSWLKPLCSSGERRLSMKTFFKSATLVLCSLLLVATVTPLVKGEMVQNQTYDREGFLFVPCANGGTGEMVHIVGQLHIVTSVTANDNHVTLQYHTNARYSGVGLTTGDKYEAPGGAHEKATFQIPAGQPYEYSFRFGMRLVGQGPGNNFVIHQIVHLVVNANGEVTVDFDKMTSECG
jgi:hypothetical protein